MIQNIYYTLAIIVYGLFLIQFIISLFGFDADIDFDLDGNSDFTVSDLVSFKGLTHFLMGYVGYISIAQDFSWKSQIIAVIIGIIFMVILYYCYKFILKLQHHPSVLEGSELVGTRGIIYLKAHTFYWVSIQVNGCTTQIKCLSDNSYHVGDIVLIKQFTNGNYYI